MLGKRKPRRGKKRAEAGETEEAFHGRVNDTLAIVTAGALRTDIPLITLNARAINPVPAAAAAARRLWHPRGGGMLPAWAIRAIAATGEENRHGRADPLRGLHRLRLTVVFSQYRAY